MTTNEKKTGDADDNELGMDAARDRAAAEPTPPTEPDDVAVGLDVLFTVVIAGPGGARAENVKTERDITRQNYLAWNNGSGVNGRTRRGAVMRLAVSREWDVLAIVEHADTQEREVLRLREELAGTEETVIRQGDILTGVALALKGPPAPLHTHSHHDLADVAAKYRALAECVRRERVTRARWLKSAPPCRVAPPEELVANEEATGRAVGELS